MTAQAWTSPPGATLLGKGIVGQGRRSPHLWVGTSGCASEGPAGYPHPVFSEPCNRHARDRMEVGEREWEKARTRLPV